MEGRKNQYFEISKIIKNQHLSSTCSEGISAEFLYVCSKIKPYEKLNPPLSVSCVNLFL